ncbi:MAG: CHAD domain-containing protein [Cyanobacteria bacterium J06638_7]
MDTRRASTTTLHPAAATADAPAADVVLSGDRALEALLQGRIIQLQQGLLQRIRAARATGTPTTDGERASDREQVHQLRTGLRRLRSIAEAFPEHWHGPEPASLRRLARQAGTVRDLDVLLEALEQQSPAIGGTEAKGLQRLIRRLQKQRARCRRKLAKRLRHPPRHLLSPVPRPEASECPAQQAGTGPGSSPHQALPLLRASLIRQLAVLRLHPGWGHGNRPRAHSRQECRQHELRKAFKRLRYQLELLEILQPELQERLHLLKQTQTSLGVLQDLVIWQGLLKGQLKGSLRRNLPELSSRWSRLGDDAWAAWCRLRRQWLDATTGIEAWQRWLLELEPGGR